MLHAAAVARGCLLCGCKPGACCSHVAEPAPRLEVTWGCRRCTVSVGASDAACWHHWASSLGSNTSPLIFSTAPLHFLPPRQPSCLCREALERHGGPRPPCTAAAPLAAFPHVRPRHIVQQQQPQRLRVVALSAPPEGSHGAVSASSSDSEDATGGSGSDDGSGSGGSGSGGDASRSAVGGRRQIIL